LSNHHPERDPKVDARESLKLTSRERAIDDVPFLLDELAIATGTPTITCCTGGLLRGRHPIWMSRVFFRPSPAEENPMRRLLVFAVAIAAAEEAG
jgi:hypothetical protein